MAVALSYIYIMKIGVDIADRMRMPTVGWVVKVGNVCKSHSQCSFSLASLYSGTKFSPHVNL